MKKVLLLLVSLFFIVCFIFIYTNISKKNLTASFYHWENSFNEKNVKDKVYIKILDIAYSTKIEAIKTTFEQKPTKGFIPVVYITNETMKNIDYKIISDLIIKTLKAYNYNELQIDFEDVI